MIETVSLLQVEGHPRELSYVTCSTFVVMYPQIKDNKCVKCDYVTKGTNDYPLAVHPMRILLRLGK